MVLELSPRAPAGTEAPGKRPAPKSTFSATLWALGGEGASDFIRLLSSLILTRLLLPDDFGLMAVVTLFMQGLNMFSDLGIRTIIIRHDRGDDPEFLNTMWTVRMIRGAILGLGAAAVAWPASRFYGHSILALLIPVASLNLVMDGFLSTKMYTCERHMWLARPTLITVGTYLLSILLTIAGALAFKSVWVLVGGALGGNLVKVILSHTSLPGSPNRLRWDRAIWAETADFGKWVFLSSVATFLAEQMDRLLFAKLMPLAMLGVYSIATSLARLPRQIVFRLANSIVMPSLSRVRHDLAEMNAVFNRQRMRILLGGGFIISFLIMCGPSLIHVMYDSRYSAAGWILQLSCIGSWFAVLGASHSPAVLVQGHPRWQAFGMALKAGAMALFVPFAYILFDFPGAMVTFGLIESVRYWVESARVRKSGLKDWTSEAVMSALMIVFGLAAAGIRFGPFEGSAWFRAGVSAGVFLGVWAAVGAWLLPRKSRFI